MTTLWKAASLDTKQSLVPIGVSTGSNPMISRYDNGSAMDLNSSSDTDSRDSYISERDTCPYEIIPSSTDRAVPM